jgi:hypothetical protein
MWLGFPFSFIAGWWAGLLDRSSQIRPTTILSLGASLLLISISSIDLRKISSPLHAETLAALRSVERAIQLGMNSVILEMDAAILGDALRTTKWDRSPYGCLFRQIRDLMLYEFNTCVISVCKRTCNQLAHCLAAYGACMEGAET